MAREMTKEERIRARKRAKRRAQIRRKRRFYLLLFVLFLALIIFFVVKNRKTKDTTSEAASEGMPTAGAAMGESRAVYGDGDMTENQTEAPAVNLSGTTGSYAGATDIMSAIDTTKGLDVTNGKAAVDLTQAGNSMGQINAAKSAMETTSFFTGTNQSVNTYFQAYGAGSWHGIKDVSDNICVFYEGVHVEQESYTDDDGNEKIDNIDVPFKIVFMVYEDGSFVVTEASENGKNVDDIEAYLKKIVG